MAKDELNMIVKLDKIHKFNLETDLDIDRTQLNDELSSQPSMYAWYSTLHELARNKVMLLKEEIEYFETKSVKGLEFELDQKYRQTWNEDQWGKRTESSILAKTKCSPAYIKAIDHLHELNLNYVEAQKNQGILGVAKSAFEQRKDMLISISANMRGESDVDLKVNKDKVKAQMEKLRNPKSH